MTTRSQRVVGAAIRLRTDDPASCSRVSRGRSMQSSMRRALPKRAETTSRIQEKSSEILEAKRLVQIAAGSGKAGEGKAAAVRRAAVKLGWTVGRTEDVWYGEVRPSVTEMDRLRAVAAELQPQHDTQADQMNLARLSALRGWLQQQPDIDYHRVNIAALDYFIEQQRRMCSPH